MAKTDITKQLSVPYFARLRTQLLVLVLLAFVPASILTIRSSFKERQAREENTREKTVAVAKLIAARQENFVKNAEQMFATVSQFSFLVSNTNRAFSQTHFINLQKLFPEYLDIGLIESDGTLFCSAVMTNSSPDLSKWSCFQKVSKSERFAIGELNKNGTTGRETLDFGYPIFDEKRNLMRILYACLDLSRLNAAIAKGDLTADEMVVTVFDGIGNVLARYPDAEKAIGKSFVQYPLFQHLIEGNDSAFETRGLSGIERLFGVAAVSNGWQKCLWITVGVPTKALFAEATQTLWRNLLIISFVALLGLAAAYFYAERFFLRPLHSLIFQARSLASGIWSIGSEAPGGPGELGELTRTFREMAKTLEQHQANIQTINAELEQRVRERTHQLEQAGRELEAFSYSVSHDLRAPLRHISGFVEMLRSDLGNSVSQKSRRFLGIIDDSARQMGQLIDELLVFSKMGRVEMQKTVVNTTVLVDETIAKLESEINGRNVVWKKGGLPELQADPAMLRQVFMNLISNAIKYSQPRDPATIEIGCEEKENETVVFVRDNGVGFDMRFADKLFGVFQRLHRTDEFEGTGVGLANVRRIIHRHGGRTWGEGIVGQGATFYFSLPKPTTTTNPKA